MRFFILLFLLSTVTLYADGRRERDTTHIYRKIDTTFIESYRDWLNVKMILGGRTNSFELTSKKSGRGLEYSINGRVNLGFAFSFKAIGLELSFAPKALNAGNDEKYGRSTQFALSSTGNTRRWMYEVYYRYYQGYHTTTKYQSPGDTIATYYRRPDVENNSAGINFIYIFNNKRFSSSAPYNLTQKQRKSAGSMLLGTYAFAYGINADSAVFPDTMHREFRPELQFREAASYTFGVSCGYTYTLVFFRNWFFNIATIPGISVQNFYSVNAFDDKVFSRTSASISFQSRLSLGYNRRNFFIGMSWIGNNFLISDNDEASMNYKYGVFRFYYGHRFDLRPLLKKKL